MMKLQVRWVDVGRSEDGLGEPCDLGRRCAGHGREGLRETK